MSGIDAHVEERPVWDDGTWAPLPSLEGDTRADCCVIGLGGSGLTLIEELMRRGQSVVAVDAVDVGAGAAGRNGGFLLAGTYDFYHDAVRRFGRGRAHAIYTATLEEIGRIAAATPEAVRLVGSKRIAADASEIDDCRTQFDAMRADGLPCEWYEGPEGSGLYFPSDGSFNPLQRCRLLARRAQHGGAMLYGASPVIGIEGTRVITPGGTVHAQRLFVAVDGRLERLLPELAGRVRTARLQMLATAPLEPGAIPCPVYFREGFEYWQQLPDGRVALGGFRDRGGESEWTVDGTPSLTVQAHLERFLRRHLAIDAPITHRWAASAGYTSTGLPIVEEVRPNVWALGGYSGTGNVMGAIAARAIAAAAIDGEADRVTLFRTPTRAVG